MTRYFAIPKQIAGWSLALAFLTTIPAALACPGNGAARGRFLSLAGSSSTIAASLRQQNAPGDITNNGLGGSVVGMWEVTLLAGGGVFDHAFQQFSSDGNEVQNSGLVPPIESNVCYGVWKEAGGRTFKLKHLGWEFDANSNFIGTFVMTATITLGPGGDTYTGAFVADAILPNGQIDPNQHVEGTITAKRITVD